MVVAAALRSLNAAAGCNLKWCVTVLIVVLVLVVLDLVQLFTQCHHQAEMPRGEHSMPARRVQVINPGLAVADTTSAAAAELGQNVICPFLGTLLKAGVLPPVCVVHRSQLLDITVRAGLPFAQAMAHIESNFRNIPGGFIDICCMEGATSEHVTSTGINDCETTFLNCSRDEQGTLSCADVQTEQCSLPSRDRLETFFVIVDRNGDGIITRLELETVDERRFFNDANPGGEGTIIGSFSLLMDVFGNINTRTGLPDHFTRATLEQVLLRREFPPHYNQVALRRATEVAV
mmetsp:Transcript_14004/g.33030  ORF Transcript_14004/g.33030 Transcript_14004/m.33030 type:complete len:290 (-) Transcript_14004:381-1250(-)